MEEYAERISMSGPKCNEFVLSEERRLEELRRIEEQLRREEARRLEEQKRLEEEARQRAIEKENARVEYNEDFNRRMEERRAKRKEKLLKKREQEIIAQAIEEAMVELGYDLIAAVEPKVEEENPVQAQLFSFADGVGVQVIENGERISMEVVGLGTNNRRPTEAEGEYLENQMADFCDAYTKLEEKLKEKGIVKSNTIHHLPPNKKYARILNMENFEQKKEVTTLQTIMKKSVQKTQEDMQITMKKQTEKRME